MTIPLTSEDDPTLTSDDKSQSSPAKTISLTSDDDDPTVTSDDDHTH
jgi:hypothetical protein